MGFGAHGEVWTLHRRTQVRVRRAAAPPATHRHVEAAESFLLEAIDVGSQRVAGLASCREPHGMQRIFQRAIARLERSRIAAIGVAALGARFRAAEVRQHRRVVPACGAFCFPTLVILRIAAHVHEAVDRGRAAEDLAARRVQATPAEAGLRLGEVTPVVLLHAHRNRERGGHLYEDRAVGTADLEHEDAVLSVFRQPVGEHAARGAGTDDDVIERLSRGHRYRPSRHTRSSIACSAPSRHDRSHARARRA